MVAGDAIMDDDIVVAANICCVGGLFISMIKMCMCAMCTEYIYICVRYTVCV